MKNIDLLKKKYTKKYLKELLSSQRSVVGLNRNLSTISLKSNKDYNRQKYKTYIRNWRDEDE